MAFDVPNNLPFSNSRTSGGKIGRFCHLRIRFLDNCTLILLYLQCTLELAFLKIYCYMYFPTGCSSLSYLTSGELKWRGLDNASESVQSNNNDDHGHEVDQETGRSFDTSTKIHTLDAKRPILGENIRGAERHREANTLKKKKKNTSRL